MVVRQMALASLRFERFCKIALLETPKVKRPDRDQGTIRLIVYWLPKKKTGHVMLLYGCRIRDNADFSYRDEIFQWEREKFVELYPAYRWVLVFVCHFNYIISWVLKLQWFGGNVLCATSRRRRRSSCYTTAPIIIVSFRYRTSTCSVFSTFFLLQTALQCKNLV